MYTLTLKGKFSAAHRLADYDGNCSRTHGHTWKYKIKIKANENQIGKDNILIDFRSLKNRVKDLDHSYLNESVDTDNPTAEYLAKWIWKAIHNEAGSLCKKFSRIKVTIWESNNAKVSYG